ncbi:MAG: CBS domain-containing protein, partial [Elusimicrobia bacterium]|nr:CBS domain-containing protein [Elusimicrobiota bacterium]
ALMKRRGFQKHHFALLHPGGQLGKRLTLTVKDVMRSGERNPVVRVTDSASRMLSEMTRQQAGAVSVIDAKGRLKGLITDFDLRRVLAGGRDLRSMPLTEIMNRKPTSVRPEMLAAEAAALMAERPRPLSLLPVADARGRSVGLLHMHDIRARGL